MAEKNGSGLFEITFSFLTGALIGAGLALLFAPVTGREAREYVGERFEEAKGFVGDKVEDAKKELSKLEERINQLKEKIIKTKEEAEKAEEA